MLRVASRPAGLLVVLAVCGWLAGCAGSAERLPECKGKAVPINRIMPIAGASGRSVHPAVGSVAQAGEPDAH